MVRYGLALLVSAFPAGVQAAEVCAVDKALLESGWVLHMAEELPEVWERFEREVMAPPFVKDMEAVYHSSELHDFVRFESFDSTETAREELYGDVAFYRHARTGERLELRWYEGGKKHIVHAIGRCSVDVVPLATNALF